MAIGASKGLVDTDAVTAAWEEALRTPAWAGQPVWLHGDLIAGNLLIRDGRLGAVIDFGCLAIGDPASDIATAWSFLPASSRTIFRQVVGVDDATWARARGWALSTAIVALPYYRETNPVLAGIARRAIHEVLAGPQAGSLAG